MMQDKQDEQNLFEKVGISGPPDRLNQTQFTIETFRSAKNIVKVVG